jgi:hypothetical protein
MRKDERTNFAEALTMQVASRAGGQAGLSREEATRCLRDAFELSEVDAARVVDDALARGLLVEDSGGTLRIARKQSA